MDSTLHATLVGLLIKKFSVVVVMPAAKADKACPWRAVVMGALKLHGHNDIERLLGFRVFNQGTTVCIVDG